MHLALRLAHDWQSCLQKDEKKALVDFTATRSSFDPSSHFERFDSRSKSPVASQGGPALIEVDDLLQASGFPYSVGYLADIATGER